MMPTITAEQIAALEALSAKGRSGVSVTYLHNLSGPCHVGVHPDVLDALLASAKALAAAQARISELEASS